MTQHTGNGLDRHTLAKRQCGKSVTRHVERYILVDAASRSDLLQIVVCLLVGVDGEHVSFLSGMVLVLLDDQLGTLKENDTNLRTCLDTSRANPFHSVEIDDVLRLQCLDIDVCKSGET